VQLKKVSTKIQYFQYFYPYTVAIVGASSWNQANYMSCAWHTALSFDPPLFGILISRKRFTHHVISEAKEFTVNFIEAKRVKLSARMGRRSGRDMDKIKEFQVKLSPSKIIKSPILEEAYVSFECKLLETKLCGDHDLFVGQVLAIHEEEESFNEEGLLNTKKIYPLLYLGSDFYITINPDSLKHVLPD
jgi:flavin reductase (DIM6/NTAB) family NADH-FMN oxidoreductase RutF